MTIHFVITATLFFCVGILYFRRRKKYNEVKSKFELTGVEKWRLDILYLLMIEWR